MADRPQWDYWLYEDLGDHRKLTIYHERDLDEGDWRNKKNELDIKKWCRKYFWNATEATLISFFRDPEKIEKAAEFVPWDEEDEDFKKHNELKKDLSDLYDLIRDAQEKKTLPEIFPPEMYIEWAGRTGVSISAEIPRELERAARQRNFKGRPANLFERASGNWPTDEMMATSDFEEAEPVDSGDEWDEKLTPQQKRFRNSLTKILLALLIEANLLKKEPADLAKTLAMRLEEKAAEHKDNKLFLGAETIKKRLQDAHDHIK